MKPDIAEFEFKDHVYNLSGYLRHRYSLQVKEDNTDKRLRSVLLVNEEVKIIFNIGWPRDPGVSTKITYADPTVYSVYRKGSKTFYLNVYALFKELDTRKFYPGSVSGMTRTGINPQPNPYVSIGSPFPLMADILFLNVYGEPLLAIDREEIRKFAEWEHERQTDPLPGWI